MTGKAYKLKIQSIRQVLLPIILLAAVLAMPQDCASGVKKGLELCSSVLIPSIFPALLATVMVVESGCAVWIGRRLSRLSMCLFSLPGEAMSALLLSLLGGYPAGAKAVAGLYESGAITKSQAQRMALFCFSAGPAFLIGAVGAMTGNTIAGVTLLLANTASVAIIAVLLGIIFGKERGGDIASLLKKTQPVKFLPFSQVLVQSVQKAAASMLSICIFVVAFSIFKALLSGMGILNVAAVLLRRLSVSETAASAVLPALLEISSGCSLTIRAGLAFTGFFVGFGGLAVHAQVWELTREIDINKGLFFIIRIAQGVLTAGLTALLLLFAPAVESSATTAHRAMPSTGGSALLMLLCVACVLCLPESKYNCNRKYEIE